MSVSDYNTDPDLNTTISGINIAEGCPPSGINNAIRQLMADIKSGLLPLSGGTMTGNLVGNNAGNIFTVSNLASGQGLRLWGGSAFVNGASLYLYEKTNGGNAGEFGLYANDGVNSVNLRGTPSGVLTWGTSNVNCIDSSGSGWIRYTNKLQLCWGTETSMTGARTVNFLKAFNGNPVVVATSNYQYGCGVSSLSASSFSAYLSSYTGSPTYRWFAIGTWS